MKKSVLFSICALGSLLISCNGDETPNYNSQTDQELLIASNVSDLAIENDFQSGMDAAADDSTLGRAVSAIAPCAEVTVSGTEFPKTYTIDYGTGCTHNGITRSGIVNITLSDFFFSNGTVMTIQRNNYKINGFKLAGTIVYTNITTGNNIPKWTRTISNGQITNPNNVVFTHSGTRTVQQTEGSNTLLNLSDNVWEVTEGTHTVNGPGGSSLTSTVVSPLIKMYTCPNISKGILNIQGSWLNGNLNYGTGNCDNQAVYTHSDGNTFNITLY